MAVSRHRIIHIGKSTLILKKKQNNKRVEKERKEKKTHTQDTVVSIDIHGMG